MSEIKDVKAVASTYYTGTKAKKKMYVKKRRKTEKKRHRGDAVNAKVDEYI